MKKQEWWYEQGDNTHAFVRIQDQDEFTVAFQYITQGMKSPVAERLIAQYKLASAAPDLLEACQWLVEEFDKSRPDFNGQPLNVGNAVYNRAKAAIAKAQGATQCSQT